MQKMAEPIEMPLGEADSCGSKEPYMRRDRGQDRTNPFTAPKGDKAAFCQIILRLFLYPSFSIIPSSNVIVRPKRLSPAAVKVYWADVVSITSRILMQVNGVSSEAPYPT